MQWGIFCASIRMLSRHVICHYGLLPKNNLLVTCVYVEHPFLSSGQIKCKNVPGEKSWSLELNEDAVCDRDFFLGCS